MEALPQTRIHKDAIKAWRIILAFPALLWFIPSALYVLVTLSSGISWLIFGLISFAAFIMFVISIMIIPSIRWKRWRYDVSDREIDLYRGIIVRKRTLVPINRIQHVDTRQGPVYRRFGLSSVTVSTAATTHEVPALDDATADDLRDKISELVRKVKEDV